MKVLGPLMITLLALGCSTPQDPAGTATNADTAATAAADTAKERALVATAGVDPQVKALAGSYFIAAPNTPKNVTVKLHIGEDGTAQMYMYWAKDRSTEQIPGTATYKEGILTIGNPKMNEHFTLADNGGLKYAGTRPELEGIVLAKAAQ